MWDDVQIRVSGPETAPVLIYLPGLHGDWTLIGSFKAALGESVRFVEITYPRTTSWTLTEYAARILQGVRKLGIQNGWLLAESFGSQIGWEILKQVSSAQEQNGSTLSPTLSSIGEEREASRSAGPPSQPASSPSPWPSPPGERSDARRTLIAGSSFVPLGLVIAGGFVRYPALPIVRMVSKINRRVPMKVLKWVCLGYSFYARVRHRRAPETLE